MSDACPDLTAPDRGVAIREDARELTLGAAVNFASYLAKLLQPLLLVFVVRRYGATSFGVYSAANAALFLVLRVALLGFDKAVLWQVGRSPASEGRKGLLAVFGLVAVTSSALALVVAVTGGSWLAEWSGQDKAHAALVFMAAGLLPMALMEVAVAASLGRRRMQAQAIIKEGLVPVSFVVIALAVGAFESRGILGLSIAFVASQVLGLVAALIELGRAVPGRWTRDGLQPGVVRYALPMGAAELASSAAQRMDLFFVTAFADPRSVGIYAAAMQLGNAIRAVRRSFDPIVTALFSKIGADLDPARIRATFSHATSLIVTTQTPIYAFLMLFAGQLLGLYGPGFDRGAGAVVVIAGVWMLNGMVGLNGLIVMGLGRSDWILGDVLGTIAIQAACLLVLVPAFGMTGAAVAVGLGYTVQNGVQAWQAHRLTGSRTYDGRVALALAVALVGMLALGAGFVGFGWVSGLTRRIASFVVFVVVYGALLWRFRRPLLLDQGGQRA